MTAQFRVSDEPFSLDEVKAILEVYEALHGVELGRQRFQIWIQQRHFTEDAFEFLDRLYKEKKK